MLSVYLIITFFLILPKEECIPKFLNFKIHSSSVLRPLHVSSLTGRFPSGSGL